MHLVANLNKNPETAKDFGTFFQKKFVKSVFSFIQQWCAP
jgi:hypothetical protein